MDAYHLALGMLVLQCESPPSTAQGLNALITNPGIANWQGPYLDPPLLATDAWGTPLRYRLMGKKMAVDSAGPDGQFDTTDDIGDR